MNYGINNQLKPACRTVVQTLSFPPPTATVGKRNANSDFMVPQIISEDPCLDSDSDDYQTDYYEQDLEAIALIGQARHQGMLGL